jgi:hypothetical protein
VTVTTAAYYEFRCCRDASVELRCGWCDARLAMHDFQMAALPTGPILCPRCTLAHVAASSISLPRPIMDALREQARKHAEMN